MPSEAPRESITEGPLARPLFRVAWPIVVIQLLQVTYNVADTFWLGRLSAAAVGAMSLAFPLIFLLISIAGGFTAAGAILVAQYTGAGGDTAPGTIAGQTIAFVTLLALVLSAVGYLFTEPMLAVLPSQAETSAQVVPLAAAYMKIFFLGLPFLFGFYVFAALMRGYGDTRTPMRIMFVSVVVNVVLDPFLIFGWGPVPALGIEGAAIATILSRGIGTLLGLYVLFYTTTGPTVGLADLSPEFGHVWDVVRLGTPSALEQSTSALALITMTAMVVSFAPPVVAAYGLGNRLISLVFLPAMGLGRATNTMVGQNLGAGKPDRARRAVRLGATVGSGVMLIVAVVAATVPEPIVGVFMATGTEEAAETIRLGSEYLRIASIEFVFIAIFQVLMGAFRGAGNTKTAMSLSIVSLWLGRIPAVYYLAFVREMGPTGIWIGIVLGNVVGAILAAAWFTRGTWTEAVIDEAADEDSSKAETADEPSSEIETGDEPPSESDQSPSSSTGTED